MTAADLKAWRARLGYSQGDAADQLGVTRRAVAYYEAGARPIPRTVALLAAAIETLAAKRR